MAAPRPVALWVLFALVGLSLAAPLLASDPCSEDCGPHCGDCAACPLAAELVPPPLAATLTSTQMVEPVTLSPLGPSGRPRDHVPLPG